MYLPFRAGGTVFFMPTEVPAGGMMNTRTSMTQGSRKSPPPTLRHKSEFRRVFRSGRRLRDEFVQIIFLKRPRHEDPRKPGGRVGYVIPEAAIKGAVKRNRMRRLLREALRAWWEYIEPGYDIVLQVGKAPRVDHAGYVEMVLLELFIKAELLINDGVQTAKERVESLGKKPKGTEGQL